MANAFLGFPQSYTLAASPAGAYPASNVLNDETGLIYRSNTVASVVFDIDLVSGHHPIGAILLLGMMKANHAVRYQGATSSGNRTSGTWAYSQTVNNSMSANRAADIKYLHVPATTQNLRYWRVTVFFSTDLTSTGVIDIGRILFLKKIQPPDNIEVGADVGIDDRSVRRYSRSGRRNIDPVTIHPTFQGEWPWLEADTFKADFRPLMYNRGATYPVAFVFDHEDVLWGEDDVFYGDLEKQQSITYEDGYLFSFGFAIVHLWSSLLEKGQPVSSILSQYAMALNFSDEQYWVNGANYALTALPGYTYTRSGAKSELNGTAAPLAFAANEPGVVPGVGYWSRLALTNELVQSQTFDNASWTKANATVTVNQAVAPDGTTTADLVTPAAGTSLKGVYQATSHLASGLWTASVFVKKGGHRYHQIIYDPSGIGYANFDIQAGAVQTGSGASAYIVDCGDYWRLVVVTTGDPGGQTYYLIVDSLAAGAYANSSSTTPYHLWQAQIITGHHPNGGPIIVTTTAAAALGADAMTATDTIASGDQLFWATVDKTSFSGGNDYAASFGVDGNNAIIMVFQGSTPVVQVVNAGSVVVNQNGSAQATGVITLLAKREGGTWRTGMVRGGVLTWFGAAVTAAFPTGMNKVAPGQYIGGGLNTKDAVRGVFRKLGSFSTDAAVLAAIAETA